MHLTLVPLYYTQCYFWKVILENGPLLPPTHPLMHSLHSLFMHSESTAFKTVIHCYRCTIPMMEAISNVGSIPGLCMYTHYSLHRRRKMHLFQFGGGTTQAPNTTHNFNRARPRTTSYHPPVLCVYFHTVSIRTHVHPRDL